MRVITALPFLLSEIEKYKLFPSGWNGYSPRPISEYTLNTVKQFITKLPHECIAPHLVAIEDTDVSLHWRIDDIVFIISFRNMDTLSYYYRNGSVKQCSENIEFDRMSIPEEILTLIPMDICTTIH